MFLKGFNFKFKMNALRRRLWSVMPSKIMYLPKPMENSECDPKVRISEGLRMKKQTAHASLYFVVDDNDIPISPGFHDIKKDSRGLYAILGAEEISLNKDGTVVGSRFRDQVLSPRTYVFSSFIGLSIYLFYSYFILYNNLSVN